jgi:hypothetical protein
MGMNARATTGRQAPDRRERAGSVRASRVEEVLSSIACRNNRVDRFVPQLQTEGRLPVVCPDPDEAGRISIAA